MTRDIVTRSIPPGSDKHCLVRNCSGEVSRETTLIGPRQAAILNSILNGLLKPPGIELDLNRAFTGRNFWGFYACLMHDKSLAGTISSML